MAGIALRVLVACRTADSDRVGARRAPKAFPRRTAFDSIRGKPLKALIEEVGERVNLISGEDALAQGFGLFFSLPTLPLRARSRTDHRTKASGDSIRPAIHPTTRRA